VPAGGAAVGVLVAVCRVSMAKEDGVREAWTLEAGKEEGLTDGDCGGEVEAGEG
jgi:hypothetical protein